MQNPTYSAYLSVIWIYQLESVLKRRVREKREAPQQQDSEVSVAGLLWMDQSSSIILLLLYVGGSRVGAHTYFLNGFVPKDAYDF